jgi:hypothetical protein
MIPLIKPKANHALWRGIACSSQAFGGRGLQLPGRCKPRPPQLQGWFLRITGERSTTAKPQPNEHRTDVDELTPARIRHGETVARVRPAPPNRVLARHYQKLIFSSCFCGIRMSKPHAREERCRLRFGLSED